MLDSNFLKLWKTCLVLLVWLLSSFWYRVRSSCIVLTVLSGLKRPKPVWKGHDSPMPYPNAQRRGRVARLLPCCSILLYARTRLRIPALLQGKGRGEAVPWTQQSNSRRATMSHGAESRKSRSTWRAGGEGMAGPALWLCRARIRNAELLLLGGKRLLKLFAITSG